MQVIKKIMLCTAVPFLFAIGTAPAHAGARYVPPDAGMSMDKLTPEQRDQAIEIKEKLMGMEMEYEEALAAMQSKHAHAMMKMEMQLLDLYKGH
jgi:hypothetical protein